MSGSRTGTAKRLLLGLFAAVAFTLISMLIVSALLISANISDALLTALNQLIKIAAVIAGVTFAVPRGGEKGMASGILIALVYIIAGYICYLLLGGGIFSFVGMLGELLLGCAAGAVWGAVRANMNPRRRTHTKPKPIH